MKKDELIYERQVMRMKKSIKRMIAIVSAFTMLASGINYSSVEAASETVNWNARYNNFPALSSVQDIIGYATLHASSENYTGTVTKMTNAVNRKLTLSCTTHKMSTGSLEYNNTGSMSWTISGSISKVTYRMDAYTSIEAIIDVEGTVKR